MKVHIETDAILTSSQVQNIQNKLNKETKSWLKILEVGTKVGQAQRTAKNLITKHSQIPILRGTSKDHKIAKDPNIGPELRPIMGARVGPNTSLAQIGCKILRAISNDIKECERFDVKSTEEILHKFDKYNEKYEMNDFQNKVVLSMDIKKFYPSIVPEKAADIARIMFERSKVEVDNLNVDELALYLSMNFSRNELNKENLLEVTYTKLNKSKKKKKLNEKIKNKKKEKSKTQIKNK